MDCPPKSDGRKGRGRNSSARLASNERSWEDLCYDILRTAQDGVTGLRRALNRLEDPRQLILIADDCFRRAEKEDVAEELLALWFATAPGADFASYSTNAFKARARALGVEHAVKLLIQCFSFEQVKAVVTRRPGAPQKIDRYWHLMWMIDFIIYYKRIRISEACRIIKENGGYQFRRSSRPISLITVGQIRSAYNRCRSHYRGTPKRAAMALEATRLDFSGSELPFDAWLNWRLKRWRQNSRR